MPVYDSLLDQTQKNQRLGPNAPLTPALRNALQPSSRRTRSPLTHGQLLNTLRNDAGQSALRSAYLPATNPAVGDPLNTLGSQIGRIGNATGEPLPPVGQWSGNQALKDIANRGGHYAHFANQALAGPPPAPTTLGTFRAGMGAGIDRSIGVKNPNQRTGSNQDAPRIALNRLRGGMSLSPDENTLLDDLAANTPGGMAALMAGSHAQQQADAKNIVRERGIERGEARHQANLFRDMMAPRNVRLADGQTVSAGGMPAGLAAFNAAPAGGPLREILGYGSQGAAQIAGGRLAADTTLQKTLMDNETDIQRAKILAAAQAAQNGVAPNDPNATAAPGTPTPPDEDELNLGLTPDQVAQLRQRAGNNPALTEYLNSLNMPAWQRKKIFAKYGSSMIGGMGKFVSGLWTPQE